MAHIHEQSDAYYLDQLCMIALAAAFGSVCLTLYFFKQEMLNLMLVDDFHHLLAASGWLLVGFAILRAILLWRAVGAPPQPNSHEECDHTHGECSSEHEHGWSPWRYVVVLIPVFLFLLGVPSDPPTVGAYATDMQAVEVPMSHASVVALAPQSYCAAAMLHAMNADPAQTARDLDFEAAIDSLPINNLEWKDQWVRVKGRLSRSNNDHVFFLVRFRRGCCFADAVPVRLPVVSRESVKGVSIPNNSWVEVTGRVDFRMVGGRMQTVIHVPSIRLIRPTDREIHSRML